MGKGDLKSRRGKLVNGSYGVRRRHKKNKPSVKPVAIEKAVLAAGTELAAGDTPKAKTAPKTAAAIKTAPKAKATPKAKAAPKTKKEEE